MINAIGYAILVFLVGEVFATWYFGVFVHKWVNYLCLVLALATLLIMWR